MKKDKLKIILYIEFFLIVLAIAVRTRAGEWYATTIYPQFSNISTHFNSIFPFSIGDLFVVCSLLSLIVVLFLKLNFWRKVGYIIAISAAIYICFSFSWGVNYYRDSVFIRANVVPREFTKEELKEYASDYFKRLNSLYLLGFTADDSLKNNFLRREFTDLDKSKILRSYDNFALDFSLTNPTIGAYKPMISNRLMEKVGVSGYFNPFFGEYHIRKSLFEVSKPFTFAHEAAHKSGVTSEDEANFIGFIACNSTDEPFIRFSGYYSLMGYMLSSLYAMVDENEYSQIFQTIDSRIIELYKSEIEHNRELYSETLGKAQSKIYDIFLKSNNVAEGRKSYGMVVGLLLHFQDYQKFQ
ncbi:MAG: DUF3810 domain-containing protein [Rikenellaceae bacterium]